MDEHRLAAVYVTNAVPSPARNGGERRELELIRRMAWRWDIHLVALAPEQEAERASPAARAELGCVSVRVWTVAPEQAPAWSTERERSTFVPDLALQLLDLVRRTGAVLVHFEGYFTALAAGLPPSAPVCLVEENIEWELAEQAGLDAHPIREREVAEWRRAATVGVVCEEDREAVAAVGVQADVITSAGDHLDPAVRPLPETPSRFYFVAGQDWWPTAEAMTTLLDDVWPVVSARHADASLTLFGAGSVDHDGRCGGTVRAAGYVPHIGDAVADHHALIAPIVSGGGLKIKVIEALAVGLPVFTTEVGARGLSKRSLAACVVAEPGHLGGVVADVIEDGPTWRSLAAEAATCRLHLPTWEAAANRLDALWRRTAAERQR